MCIYELADIFCRKRKTEKKKMKRNLLFLLLILSTSIFGQSNFSNGYSDGYKNGYCQNQGSGCISPLPPIAPIPNIGENLNSYQDGYNRGFTNGLNSQKSSNSNSDRQRYQTSEAKYVEDKMYNANMNDATVAAKMLYDFKNEVVKLGDTNPERQIQLCKAGLGINPKDVEFLMLIGRVYARNYNDDTNALYYLEKAYRLDTNRETGVENLINAIKNGRIERVKSISNQTNTETNSKKEEIINLEREYDENVKTRNYAKALEIANKYNNLNPSIRADFALGMSNYYLKDYPNAIKYFTLGLQKNEIVSMLFYRALSKDQVEDNYGAINDYDRIISIVESGKEKFQSMATVYNNKAYKLVKLKRFAEALPLVEKALSLNKTLWYIWDTKGEIQFNLGDFSQCIISMTEAINLKQDSNSYFYRGLSNFKLKKNDLGCKDLSKAGELGKNEAYIEIKKNCK